MEEERMFFIGEMRQLSYKAGRTGNAKFTEGGEGFPIHHGRNDVRKEGAQSRQNLEALGIQVAPVDDGTLYQPGDSFQVTHHEAAAKERERIFVWREREER